MKLHCTNRKTFELSDNSEKLGQLHYDGFFTFRCQASVGNENYDIKPTGVFGTSMSVTRDGKEVANLKMNWKGNIIISLQNGEELVLKATGIFMNNYVLEDKDQQKILLLKPDFDWTKFSYQYDISYDQRPKDLLLVLLAVYSANYFIAAMSAAI
jgi:hypothetical protein